MERLKGKTALVVGAGSIGPGWGNGKATAVTFAREGAQVFCVDRIARGRERNRRDHRVRGRQGDRIYRRRVPEQRRRGDGRRMPQGLWPHRRARQQCRHRRDGERGRCIGADWDRVFAVNLKSAFLAMKHVIPVMARQGGGSIINISSIASIRHTRRVLRHLCRDQGRDEPDDAHNRGRIRCRNISG